MVMTSWVMIIKNTSQGQADTRRGTCVVIHGRIVQHILHLPRNTAPEAKEMIEFFPASMLVSQVTEKSIKNDTGMHSRPRSTRS